MVHTSQSWPSLVFKGIPQLWWMVGFPIQAEDFNDVTHFLADFVFFNMTYL